MGRSDSRPIDATHTADAFGEMVWDAFHDERRARPQYRRDDGQVTDAHLDAYFTPPAEWPATLESQLARLDGRVLDVGCGPGKHARYLQNEGHDVLAIDRSPGAIAVASEWGVEHPAVMDMHAVDILENTFEGCIVLGKQIALGDTLADLTETLETLGEAVQSGGQLLADFDAPERRGDGYLDDHRVGEGAAYRRFRVEYDDLVGPWVDLLMIDQKTLENVVAETPWNIVGVHDNGEDRSDYLVRFERE